MFGAPSLLLLFVEIVTHFGHRTAGKQASSNQKHFARNGPCVTIMMLNAKIIVLLNNHSVHNDTTGAPDPVMVNGVNGSQKRLCRQSQKVLADQLQHTKSINSR